MPESGSVVITRWPRQAVWAWGAACCGCIEKVVLIVSLFLFLAPVLLADRSVAGDEAAGAAGRGKTDLRMGLALLRCREWDNAIQTLNRSLSDREAASLAHRYLGLAYGKTHQFDQALVHLTSSLILDPSQESAGEISYVASRLGDLMPSSNAFDSLRSVSIRPTAIPWQAIAGDARKRKASFDLSVNDERAASGKGTARGHRPSILKAEIQSILILVDERHPFSTEYRVAATVTNGSSSRLEDVSVVAHYLAYEDGRVGENGSEFKSRPIGLKPGETRTLEVPGPLYDDPTEELPGAYLSLSFKAMTSPCDDMLERFAKNPTKADLDKIARECNDGSWKERASAAWENHLWKGCCERGSLPLCTEYLQTCATGKHADEVRKQKQYLEGVQKYLKDDTFDGYWELQNSCGTQRAGSGTKRIVEEGSNAKYWSERRQKDPGSAHVLIQYALSITQSGESRLSYAQQLAENAIRIDPKNPQAYAALGRIQVRRKDGRAAAANLQKALEMGAGTYYVYSALGQAFEMQNDYDRARESYLRAVEKRADAISDHYALGILFRMALRFPQARSHFEEVIRIARECPTEGNKELAKAAGDYLKNL